MGSDGEESPLAKVLRFIKENAPKTHPYSAEGSLGAADRQVENEAVDVWRGKRKGGNRAPKLEPKGTKNWRTGANVITVTSGEMSLSTQVEAAS